MQVLLLCEALVKLVPLIFNVSFIKKDKIKSGWSHKIAVI